MKIILAMATILFLHSASEAAELKGVKLDDQTTVAGKTLLLNGMGLRTVTKFGFPIKIYVGALYLEKKSSNTDEILKSKGVKVLVMHFLYGLDRNQLVEAFQTGLENGCYVECEKRNEQWTLFSPQIVSMRNDNEIRFTFYDDKVDVNSNGPNAKHEMLTEAAAGALSHNLLSMFINAKKPPTEDLRKGLLSIK